MAAGKHALSEKRRSLFCQVLILRVSEDPGRAYPKSVRPGGLTPLGTVVQSVSYIFSAHVVPRMNIDPAVQRMCSALAIGRRLIALAHRRSTDCKAHRPDGVFLCVCMSVCVHPCVCGPCSGHM